jgi:hypothetical protein
MTGTARIRMTFPCAGMLWCDLTPDCRPVARAWQPEANLQAFANRQNAGSVHRLGLVLSE